MIEGELLAIGFKHDKVCQKTNPKKNLVSKTISFNVHIPKDI
jgi:hypothetical protein